MKSAQLIHLLQNEKSVFIQTHDFPDPDAIAAAFGLQYFLRVSGITSTLLYEGELQTNPIEKMIRECGIDMHNTNETVLTENDSIIVIDGCVGNKNVSHATGKIVAVIDHHQGGNAEDVPFIDIRSEYGSSATIISEYLQEQHIPLTVSVATALAIGIHTDTNSFRRRTHTQDIAAYAFLFDKIDQQCMSMILRNNVHQDELVIYQQALNHVRIDGAFAFYYYPDQCPQNLLGILADFFLAIAEVEYVVLCAKRGNHIIFSVRSERPEWNAGRSIKEALRGIGAGGGHKDMAGGIIKNAAAFDPDVIFKKFRETLKINNETH